MVGDFTVAAGAVDVVTGDDTLGTVNGPACYLVGSGASGSQYLDLASGNDSAGTIEAEIPVTAGRLYTLTYAVAGNQRASAEANNTVTVDFGPASDSFSLDAIAAFATRGLEFTAAAEDIDDDGQITLRFADNTDTFAGALLDNVVVTETTPEPPPPADEEAPEAPTKVRITDPITVDNQDEVTVSGKGEPGTTANISVDDNNRPLADPVTDTAEVDEDGRFSADLDVSGLGDGTITATVFLTDDAGNEGDSDTDKAIKNTFVPPAPPTLSIDDVEVLEGDDGKVPATFTVTLSERSNKTVKVNLKTKSSCSRPPTPRSKKTSAPAPAPSR